MATIKHAFTCAIADDPIAAAAGQVVPSNWNADHSVTLEATDIPAHASTHATGQTDAVAPADIGALGLSGGTLTGAIVGNAAAGAKQVIKPLADSVTAVQMQKADGTNILNIDSTNGRVGIGTATPGQILNVVGGANSAVLYTTGYQNRFHNSAGSARFVFAPGNSTQHAFQDMYNGSTVKTISFDAGGDSYFNGGNLGIGTTTPAGKLHSHIEDAGTTTTVNLLTLSHNTTGTADVGLGVGINALAESTTTADQQLGGVSWKWTNATHATLASKFVVQTRTGGAAVADNLTLDGAGNLTVTGSVTGTQFNISLLNTAPASATATGTVGEIRLTATHIYVCIATDTWVRSALTTW